MSNLASLPTRKGGIHGELFIHIQAIVVKLFAETSNLPGGARLQTVVAAATPLCPHHRRSVFRMRERSPRLSSTVEPVLV